MNNSKTLKRSMVAALGAIVLTIVSGCGDSPSASWRNLSADPIRPIPRNVARVAVSDSDIAHGMRAVFGQMAQAYGSVDPEPIIRDFATPIRKGLYECGACQVNNLRVNGVPLDLCAYFLPEPVAQLHIDLYVGDHSRADFTWHSRFELAAR